MGGCLMMQTKSDPVKPNYVKPLYASEKDNIKLLIKRIMYAEGDHLDLNDKSVAYIKKTLFDLVSMFEVAQDCNGALK
jgi:hypothetical protein